MTKLLIRKTNVLPAPSTRYVDHQISRDSAPDPSIAVHPTDRVRMVDELMLGVQQSIHPTVTWVRNDHMILYTIQLRWQSPTAEMELSCHADWCGFHLWLFPCHDPFGSDRFTARGDLASWTVKRSMGDALFGRGQRGDLKVQRYEKVPGHGKAVTPLQFDDPAFEGVPRESAREADAWWPALAPSVRLIDDVVMVTRRHLKEAGLA